MAFDITDKKLIDKLVHHVIFEPNTLEVAQFFELDKEDIRIQQEASKIVAYHMASRHVYWSGAMLNEETLENFQAYCEKIAEFSLCLNESCIDTMLEAFTQEMQNPKGELDNDENVFLKQKSDGTYALSTHFIDIMYESMHAIFDYSLLSDSEKVKRKAVVDNFLNHYDAALDTSARPDFLFDNPQRATQAVENLLPIILKKQPVDLVLDNTFLENLYEQLNKTQDFKAISKSLNLQTKEVATQQQVCEIVANHVAFKLLSYPHRLHFDLAIKQLSDFSLDLHNSCIGSMSLSFRTALEASKNMFSELDFNKLDKNQFPLYSEYSSRLITLMLDNFKQQGLSSEDISARKDFIINALTGFDILNKPVVPIKRPNVNEFRNQQFSKTIKTDTPKI